MRKVVEPVGMLARNLRNLYPISTITGEVGDKPGSDKECTKDFGLEGLDEPLTVLYRP